MASQILTDHEEIKKWAEERGGTPATVEGTNKKGIGMLRFLFSGEKVKRTSLAEITWEEFFAKFEEKDLALLCQEKIGGKISRFFKFIKRK